MDLIWVPPKEPISNDQSNVSSVNQMRKIEIITHFFIVKVNFSTNTEPTYSSPKK